MIPSKPLLLVVDDERGILEVVSRFAERAGFEVAVSSSGREALDHLCRRNPDVALVDLRMPDMGGLDVLRGIRETNPSCQVILMTGYASIETAVEAVKLGAVDYVRKPIEFSRLQAVLAGIREELERRRSAASLEGEMAGRLEFCGMIGRSAQMQELFELLRRLAPHVRAALVAGETGTGKELVARAIHRLGPRREKPFVSVSCSSVVDSGFESELFGSLPGGVHGNAEPKPGLLETADGGTLFLDEVGDLPPAAQARLLRVVESGEIARMGALEPKRVDVQVISATSRDLRGEVASGRFRSDLFYRLNIVQVHLPPLRERREDIPSLTAAFVQEFANRLRKPLAGVTASAERMLVAAEWPGNVRELRNAIERACILAEGDLVTDRDLAGCMVAPAFGAVRPAAGDEDVFGRLDPAPVTDPDLLSTVERQHILRALRRSNGNKKAAARMLGLSRRALYRRLERLDLGDVIHRRRDPALQPDALAGGSA